MILRRTVNNHHVSTVSRPLRICKVRAVYDVKGVIFTLEKTIKRIGNLSSNVYFWTDPLENPTEVEIEEPNIDPRCVGIIVTLILICMLMFLNKLDNDGRDQSFE